MFLHDFLWRDIERLFNNGSPICIVHRFNPKMLGWVAMMWQFDFHKKRDLQRQLTDSQLEGFFRTDILKGMCDFLYNLFCKKTKRIHVYDVSTFLNFQQENTTKLIYCKSVLVKVVVRNIPSSFFLKIFFEKISQILPGWGLEEHCWDNVLVAVVLLNFRPPVQYHAVARSTMEWQRRVPTSSSSSSRAGCPRQPGSYFRNEDFCFRASPRSLSSSSLQIQYISLSKSYFFVVFILIIVINLIIKMLILLIKSL